MRRKFAPYESFASVMDRVLEHAGYDLDMTVEYPKQPSLYEYKFSASVSPSALEHLKRIKKQYNIKSLNEVLWRVLSNYDKVTEETCIEEEIPERKTKRKSQS